MTDLTLVTGATGFIGHYVLQRLRADGKRVRVLARRPERLPADLCDHLEVAKGDLRDEAAVARAMSGVHTVLHLGACARAWSKDPNEFTDVNVRAVETLLAAAARERVERLVHVSTILTLPPHRPAAANGHRSQRRTPYEVTKLEGERLVASYAAAGHNAVIVHPARVYGPGPLNDANSVTRVIAAYLRGGFRVRLDDDDVLANYVHARDVANGISLAALHGQSGVHYVLGGENSSFRGLLELVAELSGVRRRVIALAPPVAYGLARAAEWWGKLGGPVSLTPSWVRIFLEDRRVSFELARRDLGYDPLLLREGLSETIDWLKRARHFAGA